MKYLIITSILFCFFYNCVESNSKIFKGVVIIEYAEMYTPVPTSCYDFKTDFDDIKIRDTISDTKTLSKVFELVGKLVVIDTSIAYSDYLNTRLRASIVFPDSSIKELCFGSRKILLDNKKVNFDKDLIKILKRKKM